jgi:hypothetical protein
MRVVGCGGGSYFGFSFFERCQPELVKEKRLIGMGMI